MLIAHLVAADSLSCCAVCSFSSAAKPVPHSELSFLNTDVDLSFMGYKGTLRSYLISELAFRGSQN